jgi:glutathione S-transferase
MIVLYTFGPYFGLPDASPFVMKTMLLLKFAGLEFTEDRGGYRKAPKGKLPYINDAGEIIADSTFIRRHIETKYGFDFDADLSAEQKAIAWAVERMCEDHLYFALAEARWMDDANFAKGPAQFFAAIPAPLRGVVSAAIRRKVGKMLRAQGLGRHSRSEIGELAERDIDALATFLDGKSYLFGDRPCGADATAIAFVAGALAPAFETSIRAAAEGHKNLVAYRDRLLLAYFPKQHAA